MKILYLEASSGQVVGGSLTGLLHLIKGLRGTSFEPSVILYEEKAAAKQLLAQGIPVRIFSKRRLPKEHGLQNDPRYLRAKKFGVVSSLLRNTRALGTFLFETLPAALRLSRLFREERPDVVHVCNGFRGNMDAIVAARICGIPCIVHSKGFDKHGFIERWFAPGVGASVCMTKAIEEHCRDQGIRPPEYNVVYDGLDLDEFRPTRERNDVREEMGIDADTFVVGVVGNIQEWKGQLVLLEALASLRTSVPEATALIVGGVHRSGMGYADRMRRFVEEQELSDHVVMTGARDDVGDLMNGMDVVVHTSVRGEPFGRVIIEAMAVGKPVVATRAGGVPEFVVDGENGLLVEPGDVHQLVEVLGRLHSNPDLRKRLAEGASRSVQNFSIRHHVQEMTKVYERVARRYGIVGAGYPASQRTHAG